MPTPRKTLVSLDATPYYHCVSRCVRRAFLCGQDVHSGQSYEHRRAWIEERIRKLAEAFAVDLCAYAVMSNHYHVVLHMDAARAQSWDALEVIRRWQLLYVGHPLAQQFARGEAISKAERKVVDELIAQWRSRLMDISWYMRCLNESIARQANAEDVVSGKGVSSPRHCWTKKPWQPASPMSTSIRFGQALPKRPKILSTHPSENA